MKILEIYCDGSCRLNDIGKPGTCAYIVIDGKKEIHRDSKYHADTTNNRMELEACIMAMNWVLHNARDKRVYMHFDSQYVQMGISQWLDSWVKRNWKTSAKEPVKNEDLWKKLYELRKKLPEVQFQWVRGHNGNKYNETVDRLCTQAYSSKPPVEVEWNTGRIEQFPTVATVNNNSLQEAQQLLLEIYKETLENRPIRLRDKVKYYLQSNQLI